MSNIMKQGSDPYKCNLFFVWRKRKWTLTMNSDFFGRLAFSLAVIVMNCVNNHLGDMQRAESVLDTRVCRTSIHKPGIAKLKNITQTLKCGMANNGLFRIC